MRNSLKVWTLLAVFSLVLMLAGQALGDRRGMIWGLTISLGINTAIYLFGHRRLLRIFPLVKMEGQDSWGLLPLVEKLAQKAGLPVPEVYLTPLQLPTSWSAGSSWKGAKIILSEGLLRELPLEQVAATVAFEMSRIKRHDTLAVGMAAGLASSLTYAHRRLKTNQIQNLYARQSLRLCGEMLEVICKPLSAFLVRCSLNRSDFFQADKETGDLIGHSQLWGETIWNLSSYAQTIQLPIEIGDAAAFAVNPLTARGLPRYFDAQPLPAERISRLVGHYPI